MAEKDRVRTEQFRFTLLPEENAMLTKNAFEYNRHDYVSLAKDTAHRQLSTIQDYYETPEDSVRIDTAKAIGKFLSRSGKSDSESKVTISLKDEDFAKKLEEVASDSAGKQMLEFAIAMYEKNNSGK